MGQLKWNSSDAVFVTEIDDDHKEIFEALGELRQGLSRGAASMEIHRLTERLVTSMVEHFAHEERLMRAGRYGSLCWHLQQHQAARKRVGRLVLRMEGGDRGAGGELVEYLTLWLRNHTRLADRMMGAFLRNQQRICKVTFQAGTKPRDACDWVSANGERFDPASKVRL